MWVCVKKNSKARVVCILKREESRERREKRRERRKERECNVKSLNLFFLAINNINDFDRRLW